MIPLKDDNPTSTYPFVTLTLIAVNVTVFVFQLLLSPMAYKIFVFRTAAIPFEIVHFTDIQPPNFLPPPLTLFTAMFVHGSFLHLGGNMLYLWIFGDNVEDRIGHMKFLVFYLSTGVLASLFHVISHPSSTVPMIGASGAIAGILGAYFLLFPRAHVMTLIFLLFFVQIVRIPALVFLGLWFAIQVLSSGAGGGIAWYAHIGGFLAGFLAVALLLKRKKRPRWLH
jgi:membrane associated rhomboid family serine protease